MQIVEKITKLLVVLLFLLVRKASVTYKEVRRYKDFGLISEVINSRMDNFYIQGRVFPRVHVLTIVDYIISFHESLISVSSY